MAGKAASPDELNEREKAILERLAIGLSDQQIADELFLSLNTVKWYNRQIYSKLGVSSRTQAVARINHLVSPHENTRHNLPAPTTPFIGRTRAINELKHLLHTSRLVTLTGTGGTGKTRLALRVAADVVEAFGDGVYFVDLAPLSDHSLVLEAIGAALGVLENPSESLLTTLKRVLAQQKLLLLLDNFEHVIRAAPLVSELLAGSLTLKILVTSRESLRVAGEQEYPVLPLSLPTADAISTDELADSEAVALFVQRAQMTHPHFRVSDDTASAIARICTRLDGLPLAIELAAARSKLLTPQALLERLESPHHDSPFNTLSSSSRDAPSRQRALRDSIAWSYNLLEDGEKKLFERLAVFRGGRSLEALEAVCGDNLPIPVLDGMASLVDKSLVQQKALPTGEPRFTLLELLHEYAREQLEASGEAEMQQRLHAEYFVGLAERAEPELRLDRYDYWCQRFELERDNLRAVLAWALAGGDIALGVRLAASLGLFWYGKGHHIEGIRWMEQLIERLDEVPVAYHPKFLVSAGHLAWLNDLETARHLFTNARDLAHELGDNLQTAWALTFLGYTNAEAPEIAMPFAEASLAMFRELNHQPGVAQALNVIGEIARVSGDDERAKHAYTECLSVSQTTGEVRRIGYMYNNLAYIAQHEGNHMYALDLGRRTLRLARQRNDRRDMAETLLTIAGSLGAMGKFEDAARLYGASEAALERMGAILQPTDQPEYDRALILIKAELDNTTFRFAWDEGSLMTLEQSVANALGEDA